MLAKKTSCKEAEDCKSSISCPVGFAIAIIGGKWKIPILYTLQDKTMRFNELKKALPIISQKMLTQQLRELENDGLIWRKVYAVVPPKVEYGATHLTKKLEPILDALCEWGCEQKAIYAEHRRQRQRT